MSTAAQAATSAAEREIAATRVLDAPRERVFRMWTEPERVARWWGPRGFTTTIHAMNVRPGGEWRFVMHGPDGVAYLNRVQYLEIATRERLVYDHVSGPTFRMTVTFEEDGGGRTRLTARMLFDSAEARDKTARQFGAVEGLQQTLERLAEELARG